MDYKALFIGSLSVFIFSLTSGNDQTDAALVLLWLGMSVWVAQMKTTKGAGR